MPAETAFNQAMARSTLIKINGPVTIQNGYSATAEVSRSSDDLVSYGRHQKPTA
jgi:hypothetical protein